MGIAGSLASSAFSKASIDWWAAPSFMKTSVLPHQTITTRSQPLSALNLRMSARSCSARSFLFLPFFTLGPFEPLDVPLIEHGRHRLDGLELGLDLVEQGCFEHPGGAGRLIGVLFENVPAAKHDVVEVDEWNGVFDVGRTTFSALPQAEGPHLGQRADWIGQAFPDGQYSGNGGRADSPEADEQDAQLAFCWSDFKVFHIENYTTGSPVDIWD